VTLASCTRLIAALLALGGCVSCDRASNPAPPMCAIDMGSNSFRRIVGRFDGEYRQSAMDVRTLGVGDDLARHGAISSAKLAEIEATLGAFHAACVRDNASPIRAIGTAAFREAPNADVVVKQAAALGIEMEIATEERESELAYLVGSLGQSQFAVIDNGSRSIELVADDRGRRPHLVFNLGYRVAFERFFADEADAAAGVANMRDALDKQIPRAAFMKGRVKVVGVEFGDMVEVLFGGDVEGRTLTHQQLEERLRAITSLDREGFARLKQTDDLDRALPRLVVALWVIEAFGYPQLELTRRELGTGLIIEAGR
jgi:exopolyphosphatase/pppGpp-phosphohydrolase